MRPQVYPDNAGGHHDATAPPIKTTTLYLPVMRQASLTSQCLTLTLVS